MTLKGSFSLGAAVIVLAAVAWFSLAQPGKQLPADLEFRIIDGRRIQLSELAGKPLIVSFWATTCGTCIRKTPELISLYREIHPGAELVAVAMSYDPPNRILDYSSIHDIPYPISLDLDGSIAKSFDDVSLTPTIFLLDTSGKIVFSQRGDIDISVLRRKLFGLIPVTAQS